MAALNAQSVVDAGTAPTFAASSASDTAPVGNGHNHVLVVRNDTGGAVTVTLSVPGNTTYGQPTPDPAIAVPDGEERWIPLRKEYANPSVAGVGRCTVAFAGGTPDVAVVKVG